MNFDKVLVANRGEIAVRIIRSCKQAGCKTVAVHSDADCVAAHVAAADEAVHIGAAPAGESYLAIGKIIAAALATGAQAVHPGYGFLSERAEFAEAVAAAGLVFIGPDAPSIAAMGNKSEAKRRMLAAGVPCIPGYQGDAQDDDALAREAQKIGLPVMVKAAAGGGGRGMRRVLNAADLLDSIRSARSEAQSAFGDGQLLLEKAVEDARHVEIQIFGDRHGNTVHLGERDCSVQRRNQKVVEEAPSPAVSANLRERMGAAAVAAAKAVNYVGAGTVEFMLAKDGAFYFLEMNTRLQVEHPVTEMVYGVDLVEWQLRVAQGAPLPMTQAQITARQQGWAIEVRLCSEDPAQDFMPQTGKILAWRVPAGEGLRADHGLREGGVIGPHYDSLQAKLIAWGQSRDEARNRLLQMLDETVLLGVACNRDFLRQIVSHPAFASGQFSTGFIAQHLPPERVRAARQPGPAQHALALALTHHLSAQALQQDALLSDELLHWQSSAPAATTLVLQQGGQKIVGQITPLGGGRYEILLPAAPNVSDVSDASTGSVLIELIQIDAPDVRFRAAGVSRKAHFARCGPSLWLAHDGATLCFEDITYAAAEKTAAASDGRLLAPMDGKLAAVFAAAGDTVEKGQTLAVLEAMKMEFQLASPVAGQVKTVSCQPGQQVKARQALVEVQAAVDSSS